MCHRAYLMRVLQIPNNHKGGATLPFQVFTMKKLLFLLLLLPFFGLSQTTGYFRYDTVKFHKVGANSEFILENATRGNTNAFLQNYSQGRTRFAYALDSVWLDGDSIRFRYGSTTIAVHLGGGSSIDTTSLSNRINLKVNISDTAAMLAPYLYNANEGLSVSGKYAQLGGPLGTASPLLTNRQIDLNDKLLYFTRGVPTPDYTAFDDRYTPFNVHIVDSVTSDAPDFDVVPKSGGNFHRTIKYYPPGYKVFNRYGWRMALETQVGDSVIEPSVGGDYYAALIAEHQISPLTGHTGRSVVRSGHGGFSYNFAHEGIPTLLANIFFDSTDATRYIYYKGFLTGVRPYLVMANGATDTVENISYYAASSFVNTPSWVKRSYVLRPEATHNRSAQPFFLYDSTRRERSFHAGNFALGPGVDSSDYKLDVRGTGRFSDSLTLSFATNTADTTGYDVVLRRRSDGTITRVSASQLLAFGGSGGSSLFGLSGTNTATGSVTGDLDGFTLNINDGADNLFSQTKENWAFNTTDDPGMLLTTMFGGVNGTDVRWNAGVTNGNEGTEGGIIIEALAGRSRSYLTSDSIHLVYNDGVVDISDSTDYYFPVIDKTTGALSKTHWPVPGSGATWGSITGTLSSQTDLQTALDAKLAHTTANPTLTATNATGTGYVATPMFARLTSNHSLADVNTAQAAFNSSFDTWTLQGNTTYEIEGLYHLNMGTTNHLTQMGFTLGGGASVTSIFYDAMSWTNAPGSGQTAQYTQLSNVTTTTTVSLFDGAATKTIKFKGHISMNAGGTVQPFVQFSAAPGGTNEMVAGSYIKFVPIGNGTVTNQGSVN